MLWKPLAVTSLCALCFTWDAPLPKPSLIPPGSGELNSSVFDLSLFFLLFLPWKEAELFWGPPRAVLSTLSFTISHPCMSSYSHLLAWFHFVCWIGLKVSWAQGSYLPAHKSVPFHWANQLECCCIYSVDSGRDPLGISPVGFLSPPILLWLRQSIWVQKLTLFLCSALQTTSGIIFSLQTF